jgi:hypothetical protein
VAMSVSWSTQFAGSAVPTLHTQGPGDDAMRSIGLIDPRASHNLDRSIGHGVTFGTCPRARDGIKRPLQRSLTGFAAT